MRLSNFRGKAVKNHRQKLLADGRSGVILGLRLLPRRYSWMVDRVFSQLWLSDQTTVEVRGVGRGSLGRRRNEPVFLECSPGRFEVGLPSEHSNLLWMSVLILVEEGDVVSAEYVPGYWSVLRDSPLRAIVRSRRGAETFVLPKDTIPW
jgi:hypothetical protein